MRIRSIRSLPPNFDRYEVAVARGLGALYGPGAERRYLRQARTSIGAGLGHPDVRAFGALENGDTVGMIIGTQRDDTAYVSYLHLLPAAEGRAVESALAEAIVAAFRDGGARHIIWECVSFCRIRVTDTLLALGFTHVARELMTADAGPPPENGPPRSRILEPRRDLRAAARCLVDAYRDEPGRRLHVEVGGLEAASDFIARVLGGNFGRFRRNYARIIEEDGAAAGLVLGCEAGPECGFVLQVAVPPAWRRRGHAGALVRELNAAFHDEGAGRVALGVTRDNPARRLYQRLGFATLRPVDAYFWHAPEGDSP